MIRNFFFVENLEFFQSQDKNEKSYLRPQNTRISLQFYKEDISNVV